MYSNNSIGNQIFVPDGIQEVVTVNLSSNSNEPTNYKTHHQHNDESIAHDYITTQIVSNNYISHELLHQPPHRKIDFQQAKDSSILLQVYSDPSNSAAIIQSSNGQPPLLTPMTGKYVDMRHVATASEEHQMQMIAPNDDSDKSDCEANDLNDFKTSMKLVKRSLPHKKRIAKRIVSDNLQPYNNQQEEHFGIVLPNDETNNIRFNANFVCNLCGDVMEHQIDFYIHLKKHYEPNLHMNAAVDDTEDHKPNRIVVTTNLVGENLIINHQNNEDDVDGVSGNLIESLEDSSENIKENEMHHQQVMDEFNEFSEPEDMMEDFRKEVEKVVETIGENDCGEAQWASVMNYQDEDIEEPQDEQNVDLHMYQEISQNVVPTNYTTIQRTSNEVVMHQPTPAELKSFDNVEDFVNRDDEMDDDYEDEESNEEEDEEDEDDKKTLEQLRKETIEEKKTPTKVSKSSYKKNVSSSSFTEQDKEDIELNECLKKINNFKCTVAGCVKTFNSRTALGYHLKTHTMERRFVCDQCGKKFLTNGALKVHIRLHTDDRPYKCKNCEKSFRQWGDLKYHETSIHSNKKDHICEFCAKAFARKYSLVIHRRIHTGERNYKCTECDKSFRASSYLLNHRRIHTGEKPYVCSEPTCQKKFRVVGDLKRHMKIHERLKSGVQKEKPQKSKEDVNPVKVENVCKDVMNIENGCVDLRIKEEKTESIPITATVENTLSSRKGRRNVKTKKSIS